MHWCVYYTNRADIDESPLATTNKQIKNYCIVNHSANKEQEVNIIFILMITNNKDTLL